MEDWADWDDFIDRMESSSCSYRSECRCAPDDLARTARVSRRSLALTGLKCRSFLWKLIIPGHRCSRRHCGGAQQISGPQWKLTISAGAGNGVHQTSHTPDEKRPPDMTLQSHQRTSRLWTAVVVALFAAMTASPVAAQHDIGHAECCGRPDVILIRGGMGYWPGAQAMADDFCELGYSPTIIHGWEHAIVARKIACASRKGKLAGGVVIVGYSSGADSACLLARGLQKYGIRVETMVLIESTLGVSVPGNVDYCVNYYVSRSLDAIPMFRGVPVEAECPCTTLHNINLKDCPAFADQFKRNHFVIGSTSTMRQMTTDVVLSRQNLIEMTPGEVMPPIPAELSSIPVLPILR